jgi:hypothetical protein
LILLLASAHFKRPTTPQHGVTKQRKPLLLLLPLLAPCCLPDQVASSTNAVATGITEKLNQKRINAAMSEPEEEQLGALQLVAQIGEGGFAKVFRGLYRWVGLTG